MNLGDNNIKGQTQTPNRAVHTSNEEGEEVVDISEGDIRKV